MLTEFTLANFKSYRNSRLSLGSLTLLIGANAAGKSNALEGLRFLSWLAQGQKLSSIQYDVNSADRAMRGRVKDLCYREESTFSLGCRLDSKEWNQLDIKIRVHNGEMKITDEHIINSDSATQLYETVPMSPLDLAISKSPNSVWVCYYDSLSDDAPRERGDGYLVVCDNQKAMFAQLDVPKVDKDSQFNQDNQSSQDNHFNEIQQRITGTVQEYQRVLQNVLFFDPVPAQMRDYSQKSDYQRLLENGSNLSSVLFHLWENQPDRQQEILNFIQSLPEQAIDGLDFLVGPRDEVMVRLSETFGNTQRFCEAALLSDGTLRVLAIAAAMFSAAEGSLIVIEEIDNGIHPSRAKHLLGSIRDIAERRNLRVLISTHNPALMDAIPDVALGDVVFCYRDPSVGDSRLMRLGDLDDFPSLIFQGSLGQLVTKGIVDRFIKSPHTPEARKQQAMDWLTQLQEYGDE
jgi:predicted ATPase